MKERIQYIDAMRGFAILLVVIGHLIQYNFEDAFHNDIFNIIYSFHMPLFFFISGCVSTTAYKGKTMHNKVAISFLGGVKGC